METCHIETLNEDITSGPVNLQAVPNPNWKLEKVRYLALHFPECQLNLPFFNPFIKSNRSIYTFRLLMRAL